MNEPGSAPLIELSERGGRMMVQMPSPKKLGPPRLKLDLRRESRNRMLVQQAYRTEALGSIPNTIKSKMALTLLHPLDHLKS